MGDVLVEEEEELVEEGGNIQATLCRSITNRTGME